MSIKLVRYTFSYIATIIVNLVDNISYIATIIVNLVDNLMCRLRWTILNRRMELYPR